jgi:SAM-dependent methyltransferase
MVSMVMKLDYLLDVLKERGLLGTMKVGVSYVLDYFYDVRNGTDTFSWAALESLSIDSPNKAFGTHYQPSGVYPLQRVLAQADIPQNGKFVDLGCGKGRTLLIASRLQFTEVIGVEFSAELCEVAERNVRIYEQRRGRGAPITIVHSDAAEYAIDPETTVFFLFNPFGESVMEVVLNNIAESLRSHPRIVAFIYRNPIFETMVRDRLKFDTSDHYDILDNDFFVGHINTARSE